MTLAERDEPLPGRQVALVDLLDRLLAGGVVITGDIVLSIADIDLVRISLRALITSVTASGAAPLVPGDAPFVPGDDPFDPGDRP
ncbi:gas vesicle protein [Streptomyces roseolus]|uniref:gas vesicle protein n=1 Tax=Streptomyces roseolus TaxID=67358 RepID=UPI0036545858